MKIYRRIFLFSTTIIFIYIITFIITRAIYNKNPENSNDKPNNMQTVINYSTQSAKLNSSILDYTVITETPVPTRTPTPTQIPTPTIKFFTSSQFEQWFAKYADRESINKDLLQKIAVCESGLNPQAKNGIYAGIYQFSESSWTTTRRHMNQDQNPMLRYDVEEAIETAAFRLATSGSAAWPNCSK